jgi:hypothetical protein
VFHYEVQRLYLCFQKTEFESVVEIPIMNKVWMVSKEKFTFCLLVEQVCTLFFISFLRNSSTDLAVTTCPLPLIPSLDGARRTMWWFNGTIGACSPVVLLRPITCAWFGTLCVGDVGKRVFACGLLSTRGGVFRSTALNTHHLVPCFVSGNSRYLPK